MRCKSSLGLILVFSLLSFVESSATVRLQFKPDTYINWNIQLHQDYISRNVELGRVLSRDSDGFRSSVDGRLEFGYLRLLRWSFIAVADLYAEQLPGGGVVFGEQPQLDAEALDLNLNSTGLDRTAEEYFNLRLSDFRIEYQGRSGFRFLLGRIGSVDDVRTDWRLNDLLQKRVRSYRGYDRLPTYDGAAVSFNTTESSALIMLATFDRDAGWGADAEYVTVNMPLMLHVGAGVFDNELNARIRASVTPDSSSISYHVHYRIEKHEAEDFARSFVSAGITSVAFGPRIRLEYLFNGDGAVDRSAYNLPALLQGSHSFMDRHYLALGIATDPRTAPLSVEATGVLNVRDFSSKVNAGVHLALDEYHVYELALETQLTFGDTLDDFWYYPDWVGLSFNWDYRNFRRF